MPWDSSGGGCAGSASAPCMAISDGMRAMQGQGGVLFGGRNAVRLPTGCGGMQGAPPGIPAAACRCGSQPNRIPGQGLASTRPGPAADCASKQPRPTSSDGRSAPMSPGGPSPLRRRSTPGAAAPPLFGAATAELPALAETFTWHAAADRARGSVARSRGRCALGRWPPRSADLAGCRRHCVAGTVGAGRSWKQGELCVAGVGFSTSTGTSQVRRGACACACPCRRAPAPEAVA